MLLSADSGNQRGHARAPGIPRADRPPAADVRRVGVRLSGRDRARLARFGNRDELVGEYAWYAENSARQIRPVGRLKPNAFGLFDMLGNALEWCHESSPHVDRDTPAATWRIRARSTAASTASSAAAPTFTRPMGSAPIPATRSAPKTLWDDIGFRVVRTIRAVR